MPALARQEIYKLGSEMLQFASSVEDFATPKDVLEGLDDAASYVGHSTCWVPRCFQFDAEIGAVSRRVDRLPPQERARCVVG